MNNLSFDKYFTPQEVTVRSERDELVGKFVEAINREREGTRFKKVDHAWFNSFLKFKVGRTMSNSELYAFYQECDRYSGAFSKIFFGSFKNQSWKSQN